MIVAVSLTSAPAAARLPNDLEHVLDDEAGGRRESDRGAPGLDSISKAIIEQLQQDGLAPELDTLWREPALPSLEPLRAVTAAVLVIGCVGDEVHPGSVAERLAGVFPQATLQVYDRPAVLWTNRKELRERISGFLNAPTP